MGAALGRRGEGEDLGPEGGPVAIELAGRFQSAERRSIVIGANELEQGADRGAGDRTFRIDGRADDAFPVPVEGGAQARDARG